MKNSRIYGAVALWALAAGLMVYGTFSYSRDNTPAGLAWGVFLGIIAALLSSDVDRRYLMDKHVEEVEQIVQLVDSLHRSRADTRHLR